jgi:multiple sugar transport system permease protein
MPVATLAGYGLARLPHAIFYKTFALNFLIFSRILPATSLALPYFVIFSRANMYDTYISLIFIYVLKAIPLAIFMIMTFIEEVPIEIEESASIDGASMFYILVKIVFPLIAPGVAATAIFIFMYTWNDYLFVAFLTGKNAANLQIGIAQFNAEYFIKWGELCAAIIIAILPILLFTIAVQKYLVRGLTMGALKK